MGWCTHSGAPEKVIDQLGMMRERGDGTVNAPITAWHFVCADCGTVLSRHVADDPDPTVEAVNHALRKTAEAIILTHHYLRRRDG